MDNHKKFDSLNFVRYLDKFHFSKLSKHDKDKGLKCLNKVFLKIKSDQSLLKMFHTALVTSNIWYVPNLIKHLKKVLSTCMDTHAEHTLKTLKALKNSNGTYKKNFVYYGEPQYRDNGDLEYLILNFERELLMDKGDKYIPVGFCHYNLTLDIISRKQLMDKLFKALDYALISSDKYGAEDVGDAMFNLHDNNNQVWIKITDNQYLQLSTFKKVYNSKTGLLNIYNPYYSKGEISW